MPDTISPQILPPLMSDTKATKLLTSLLKIPGLSGEEQLVSEFISESLVDAGISSNYLKSDNANRRSVFGGLAGNLVLKLPGNQRGPRKLFVSHMDTVPVCRGARPVQRGDRIVAAGTDTGLGGDNRAGVAVLLSTALQIAKHDLPHPPITFLWTVQEEVGMFGARHVSLGMLGKPKMAFNWDGRLSSNIAIGSIGCYRMAIEVQGVASHAGISPETGVNAIGIASLAISDLIANGWHGNISKGRNSGTCNVGVIDGGESTNVVTDYVHVRMEARSHSKSFLNRIIQEVEKAFERACKQLKTRQGIVGKVEIQGRSDYESFLLPKSDSSVKAASRAIKYVGEEPTYSVTNGGLDANWLTARGIPTATLGCGQLNVHTVDEEIDLAQFHQARRIAMHLATQA